MERERSFTDVLADLDEGKVHAQLTKELRRMVRAVMETSKAGALSLRLNCKKQGKQVVVTAQVATKLPQPELECSLFYATEDFSLSRTDTNQPVLRGIEMRPPTPLRSVSDGEAPKTAMNAKEE